MGRNVEIKAWASNFEAQRAKAAELAASPPELLSQEDTFFRAKRGRLKLRRFAKRSGELIYYERSDASGPSESRYMLLPTREPDSLRNALAQALGVAGVVRKRREVFLVGSTRVHLDDVEGLGLFIELEAVLGPGESRADGKMRVDDLMTRLGVTDGDLIDRAYIDLILERDDGSGTPEAGA